MPSSKPGVVEAQLLWSRRGGSRRRRRYYRFCTPHPAMVRMGVGRANPTRHPGIRTGTTHKVHRAGPAAPRAIFSLAMLRNERKSFPPLFSDLPSSFPSPVPSASHRVALPASLRRPGCMRNAPRIFAKIRGWDLSKFTMQILYSAMFRKLHNDSYRCKQLW